MPVLDSRQKLDLRLEQAETPQNGARRKGESALTRSINRREFFALTARTASKSFIVLSAPAILAACDRAAPAREQQAAFQTLQADEAIEFEAIAARIIPSDETPGAREAGVIYFMDTVLADDREEELTILRQGLADLQQSVQSEYSQSNFSQLTEAQQDALLVNIENSDFFATMRFLTIAGMFSLPEYGGNRDLVGYELIGFENQHAWAPPFGYYDAEYNGGGQ